MRGPCDDPRAGNGNPASRPSSVRNGSLSPGHAVQTAKDGLLAKTAPRTSGRRTTYRMLSVRPVISVRPDTGQPGHCPPCPACPTRPAHRGLMPEGPSQESPRTLTPTRTKIRRAAGVASGTGGAVILRYIITWLMA